ncbi:unnamed protein product [Moneuplotes crassus]|uniref:Leucine-rich repeat-containing N-terminal plant-type domain-containing protein n=1 Tax=Euplotes crassus TaxID=5936 RepID=A0AAD1X8M5_EUPCR|nr:unnamed protein product [Moneuplotes crassus]
MCKKIFLLLLLSICQCDIVVDSFSFTPQFVRQASEYTFVIRSPNLSWITATQILIYFDFELYELDNVSYTCTSKTKLNTDPEKIASSPVCQGVVEGAKKYIKVTDYLVDPYAFNTTITLVISGIPNARSSHYISGIHFEIKTIVNSILIVHGITQGFKCLPNSITSPSLTQSTQNRHETGNVDITFTTSTSANQNDLILIKFPQGITIHYDFSCTSLSGFSGTLECRKLSELNILVKEAFSGSAVTSAGTFSLRIQGVYGHIEWHETESMVIKTMDGVYEGIIDETAENEISLKFSFERITSRVLCDAEYCNQATSAAEKQALVDLYTSTDGANWLVKTNWNTGDPCQNSWYGIMCNKYGQIIAINFFENKLTGTIPDSISDLTYLIYLNIWNDAREYEGEDNVNKNTISAWNPKIHELVNLEEINFINLGMTGTLDITFNNLASLKSANLGYNTFTGSLPDNFGNMPNLENFQISHSSLSGNLPASLSTLQKLKFVELDNNQFTGSAPILTSPELVGLELSDNQLSGSFPSTYFSTTSYLKLEFVNVLFNSIVVPNHCLKYVYCFKNVMIDTIDGDTITTLDSGTTTFINSAEATEEEDVIEF